jgi:hypothetical protein
LSPLVFRRSGCDVIAGVIADPNDGAVALAVVAASSSDHGWVPCEDLEGVEVHVHRVGIAGEVDESPNLGHAERREERCGVLEASSDRSPSRLPFATLVVLDDDDDRPIGDRVLDELAEGDHWRRAFDVGTMFDEGDSTHHHTVVELATGHRPEVGRQHHRCRMARSLALDDTDPQNLRERQQTLEIRRAGDRGISEVPSNGAAAVFQTVTPPGDRSEKSTRRSARSADANTRPWAGNDTGARSSPPSVPI